MKATIKQRLVSHRETLQNILYSNDNIKLDKSIILDMFDNLDKILDDKKWDRIKELENVDDLIVAVERSSLSNTQRLILLILLDSNQPLSLLELSKESGKSRYHVWGIIRHLNKHNLVKKYKRNITVYTFNLEGCKKFLDLP